jgi:hypothetical protein
MPEICSDDDLPPMLNTPEKQHEVTRQLLLAHFGAVPTAFEAPPLQGGFSKTLFATLPDSRQLVLQFRTEPLDVTPFATARTVLGPAVIPTCQRLASPSLEAEGVWAYVQDRKPGQLLLHADRTQGRPARIAAASSLGHILSRGHPSDTSASAITNRLRPHLTAILTSPLSEITPAHRDTAQHLLASLSQLSELPLWVSHYDLNALNILVSMTDYAVTGLVDWELSTPLPLGVGLSRVRSQVVGQFSRGEFVRCNGFDEAECAFWEALWRGMPDVVREMVNKRSDLLREAVRLGTFLDCFFFEERTLGCNPVLLRALPELLSHLIPLPGGYEAVSHGEHSS